MWIQRALLAIWFSAHLMLAPKIDLQRNAEQRIALRMLQMMLVCNSAASMCVRNVREGPDFSLFPNWREYEFKGKLFEDQLVGWPFTEVLEPAY